MVGAADRYTKLAIELLFKRGLANDNLPEEVEAAYADELDRCWWAMTKAAQDDVERAVTGVLR